jgi:restriction system protein
MPTITQERLGEFVKTALQVLAENDDHLPSRDVIRLAEPRLRITDHERETIPSGVVRWENALHWYTVDAVKAGWLIKRNGVWYLTEEGKKALNLDPLTFFKTAAQKYKEALAARRVSSPEPELEKLQEATGPIGEEAVINRATAMAFENAESLARSEIEDYINALGPYAFQDLVAALLRGMGYYTPFVAPQGKDGGVDISAYRDPLGSAAPRLKVQVKHREQKISVKEVRELVSLLTKEGDAGLIVSSGGFTSDAAAEIRRSSRHVEKIDLNDFIDMWKNHYDKMNEEDRRLMPLKRIAFLAPDERS